VTYFALRMLYCTDPTGFSFSLVQPATRIISLVPSLTELLYDLGLDAEVCGISKFCIHPDHWFRTKTRIGGTKNPNLNRIIELQPDLILANKEENRKEDILALRAHTPVYTSDIANLAGNNDVVLQIGKLTGRADKALELLREIEHKVAEWQKELPKLKAKSTFAAGDHPRVLYLIWRKPYMSVGSDTYIHSMLQLAGFRNYLWKASRYPAIDLESLRQDPPDIVLLSSEPYPFKPAHFEEIQAQLPNSLILPADGELFSWYGSRPRLLYKGFTALWQQIISRNNER
jgi:ABC-type Fe3+-hydroxamate transport system substrate-binding protein